ncbi:flippase [Candidatus Woesearchaeota archaeon]|nr:flippase [Candidatus Woesearchaeota archaeon]
MKTARRITANFLSLLSAEMLSRVVQLAIFIFLARYLGKEAFGIINFSMAFAMIILIVADFGFSTFLIKEIATKKNKAAQIVSNSLILKFLLGAASFLIAYISLEVLGYGSDVKVISYVMVLFAIVQSFTFVYYSVFRAFEKMYYDAIVKVIRISLLAAMVYAGFAMNYGLLWIASSFLITEIAVLFVSAAIAYSKFIPLSFRASLPFSMRLLSESSLFCFSMAFAGIFMYIDIVIISKIRGNAEVGIYSAAYNILLALIFIPMMYANAIFPVISRLHISSKNSLSFAYQKSYKYMLIAGLPVSAGVFVLSRNIINFLYGQEYGAAVLALKILSGYMFLRFINIISGFTLSSMDRQKSRVVSQGATAVMNIALDLILVPIFGFIGAAIATLITEVFFFFLYSYFIIKYGIKNRFFSVAVKPIIAVAAMSVIVSWISDLFYGFIAGALVYGSMLLILGAFDREDITLLKRVLKN